MYYLSFFFFFFLILDVLSFSMIVFQVVLRSLRKTFLVIKLARGWEKTVQRGREKKKFKYLTVLLRVFNLARGLSSGRNLSFGSS